MTRSFVVTGAARGVGRAIVERLVGDGNAVVGVDLEGPADVIGDAGAEAVTEEAAAAAETAGTFCGWVNNAAVFRDASIHSAPPADVIELIGLNLRPAITGCATAVRHFLAAGTGGAIVNVSSHQAQRPVRGALPYATAKAAVEALTRAVAVDYGRHGIRANAVALGSIDTGRLDAEIDAELRRLHPLGRVGEPAEVAAAVAFLLSDEASFINGAVLPVDGGRAVGGLDPEARELS